jgi:hypothetical protein
VGFLSQDADADLVATLQACDLNGAEARARGRLVPSWDRPGKVAVKVNLAESAQLLGDPTAETPAHTAPDQPATFAAVSPLVSSLEEDDSSPQEYWPQNAGPPELSAGHAEDYPVWPPKPQPAQATEPAQASELAQLEPVFRTSATFRPASLSEPLTPPEYAPPSEPMSPSEPTPPLEPTSPDPSPQAILSTRSAWLGSMPAQAQASETGWLSAPGEASQARWHDAQPTAGQGAAAMGAGAYAVEAGTLPAEQSASWQDHAERSREAQDGLATGWSSSASVAQPTSQAQQTPHAKPAGISSGAKTWIISALAVLVLATSAFLVWKTIFAAKTYTDSQYGYSFSYPGLWDLEKGATQLTSFSDMAGSNAMLGGTVAGHGDNKSPDDFGVVGVVVFDTSALGLTDSSQWGTQFQANLTQAASVDSSMAIVEPVSATTVGGIGGFKATITVTSSTLSVTTSFCFLIDGAVGYMAIAMAPEPSWSDNQKAFESFFDSFRPGGARI